MENQVQTEGTLAQACKRFNKAAKASGLGNRVEFCQGYFWPLEVTHTNRKGRDHETHGFRTADKAVEHIMDCAKSVGIVA